MRQITKRYIRLLTLGFGLILAGCSPGGASELARSHGSASSAHAGRATSPQAPGGVLGGLALSSNPNAKYGYPSAESGDIMISRPDYLIAWNPATHDPRWATWQLTAASLGSVHRANDFAADPDLSAYLQTQGDSAVTPEDYASSCYDRGHQVPSADRTATLAANQQTFYMSNMIPQTAYLNRVIWEHLESHTRSLLQGTETTLLIIDGPIFPARLSYIGTRNDVAIPAQNFKIVVRPGAHPTILAAVIMPNVTASGADPVTDHDQACQDSHHMASASTSSGGVTDWEQYSATLSEIAAASGLNFDFLQQ